MGRLRPGGPSGPRQQRRRAQRHFRHADQVAGGRNILRGGVEWIEADPGLHKVVILEACCDDNPWLSKSVSIYRWKELN